MGEWKETTLTALCTDISYGYTESAKLEKVGPKFLRITDIANGRINWGNVPFCPISESDFNKYKLLPGDIVIARTGATTGANYTIKKGDPSYLVFASYLIRYKIDRTKAEPSFIGQLLRSANWQDYVDAIAGGSAQPGANAKQLGSFEILLPEIPEQTAIASVLSSLDDKIDLLHRQNATLEKMAETLFRQWFVEEAKEEWANRPLSSIAVFLNGLACQKFPPKNELEKLPVLKIKELSEGITDNSDFATTDVKSEYIIMNGDVIFAWSASLMVKIWDGQDCILNQHLFKVTSKDYPKWFYFLWCKFHLSEFISIAASHATTMGHIKRRDLNEAMVSVPSLVEMSEMTLIIEPLIDKLIVNNKQINLLVSYRDNLLKKLMSGDVKVAI
jgi:type I restriction enzyme S subunit